MKRLGSKLVGGSGLLACALVATHAAAAPGDTCVEALEIGALPFANSDTTCGKGNDFNNDVAGAAERLVISAGPSGVRRLP